jgi:uncharacterized RDD family membrane protein YckC
MNCPKCATRSNTADARYCPDCGAAFGGPAAPAGPYTVSSAALALSPSPPPCDNPPYSGFWRRVGAYIIDDILIIIGYSIVSFAVASFMIGAGASSKSAARSMVAWVWLVLVVAPWLYCAFMESSNLQATVGKLALGIKVTGQDGERIGFGQATGRYFSHLLTAISFGVGYAMVVFTSRRQALHDMVARSARSGLDDCAGGLRLRRRWTVRHRDTGGDRRSRVPGLHDSLPGRGRSERRGAL